ncbi:MAG: zinc-dependent metalloprotease [Tetrasphaera sp.]
MPEHDLPVPPDPDDAEPSPQDSTGGLPPEMAEALRRMTGGAQLPPELLQHLGEMGLGAIPVAQFESMMGQFRAMFSGPDEGPIAASVVTEVARKSVLADGDGTMSEREQRLAAEAGHVADLWLGQVTELEAPGLAGRAWSRAEWIEGTLAVWRELVSPVADGVTRALGDAVTAQFAETGFDQLPAGLLPPGTNPAAVLGQIGPLLRRAGASMFSMQLGEGLAALAGETLTGTEVSLPLTPEGALVLVPANIAAFAEGLEVDLDEVWLYLAVREAARLRLFEGAPWLGPQLLTAVQDYARGIEIDTAGIESAMAGVDPTNPEALQEQLSDKLFAPKPSAAQQAALARLETWLALIEGWVDVVADRAAAAHLPHAAALAETVRRRRALGGPAEKTFAGLVGLELRPRRLRDAANLFAALEAAGGASLRDAAWGHPDIAPTTADLDDVLGYVERRTAPAQEDELDAALERMLSVADDHAGGADDHAGADGDPARADDQRHADDHRHPGEA